MVSCMVYFKITPEFNEKKIHEENQGKLFKTHSNMFVTLKITGRKGTEIILVTAR